MMLRSLSDESLAAVFDNAEAAEEAMFDENAAASGLVTDLDKAWHGIHYLLTRTAWAGEPPLNALIAGGAAFDDSEGEWEGTPPRCVSASQTQQFADSLGALSNDSLASRFDSAEMTRLDIYPAIWDRDPAEDDTLGYVLEYLDVLRTFTDGCVDRGHGMLLMFA